MNIQVIINNLKKSNSEGIQIKKQNGILTSTWLIYKKKDFYFYFDINQKIEFIDNYKYSEEQLLQEFKNANFIIELSIN